MKYIKPRDFQTTPANYAEYLKHEVSNAKKILAEPEKQWPIGSSHIFSQKVIAECKSAYQDLIIDFGCWYADGSFAGIELTLTN